MARPICKSVPPPRLLTPIWDGLCRAAAARAGAVRPCRRRSRMIMMIGLGRGQRRDSYIIFKLSLRYSRIIFGVRAACCSGTAAAALANLLASWRTGNGPPRRASAKEDVRPGLPTSVQIGASLGWSRARCARSAPSSGQTRSRRPPTTGQIKAQFLVTFISGSFAIQAHGARSRRLGRYERPIEFSW
jgi:hypothetical protein